MTLRNVPRGQNPRPAEVNLSVVDFAVSPEGTLSFGPETAHARSARSWVGLDADHHILLPGEKKVIRGRVEAPYDADGDYWAAVMVTLGSRRRQEGVNVVLRTASGLFVRAVRRNHVARPALGNVAVRLPEFPAEQAGEPQDEQADCLRVVAQVTNRGVVGFLARGTATIYRDGWRKVASMPLHARRSRVLPGHRRRFVGVLPDPLPTGDYTIRCVIEPGSAAGRKAFGEAAFTIEPELAAVWKRERVGEGPSGLAVEPQDVEVSLDPGRFTTAVLSVSNRGSSTMQVRCRLEPGSLPAAWAVLEPADFSMGPGMRRSVVCRLSVPPGAEPGSRRGAVAVEAVCAGLVNDEQRELRVVPLSLSVNRTVGADE
ncbi:MAG: hypothetical protein R6V05_13420 [Candidatus Brocadiia bacterium]